MRAPERFLEPHIAAVVAYRGDEPVAAAMTLLSHGIAGVYWVATLAAARGQGLADVVTRAVTNRGFELGAAVNTLQASPMGESIYRRMGYEDAPPRLRLRPVRAARPDRPTDPRRDDQRMVSVRWSPTSSASPPSAALAIL